MAQLINVTTENQSSDLVESLLNDQQSLTAVERFAQHYESDTSPVAEKYYRDLIPLEKPRAGEQYSFEVDLDACSGCKSCVAACHKLNGLEDDELWRTTGLLVGGNSELPVVQHVTTACHHCIEPACLDGCPVEAYEKDPDTGIVRHLDDQCIGCQYCILKCPYDVPVYSKSKGIVRKCDMCHERLAVGEAPACVQSCPNHAISIRIVDTDVVQENCEDGWFLPGAPSPTITQPTTAYKTQQVFPRNTLPADYFAVQSSHGHLPLVFMLVFTQMSVGAFLCEQFIYSYFRLFNDELAASIRPLHVFAALSLGILGLAASVFHLGRPWFAYRAILGIRKSWLSREILAFGVFAAAATLYAVLSGLDGFAIPNHNFLVDGAGVVAIVAGFAGLVCSVMIYVDTHRPLWTPFTTTAKFVLTALVLGLPTSLFVALAASLVSDEISTAEAMAIVGENCCWMLLFISLLKLTVELSLFAHLRDKQQTPQKGSAILLCGELRSPMLRRCVLLVAGGVILPAILLSGVGGNLAIAVALASTLLLTIGELHERYLFFAASVAPKMPGSQAA